MGPQLDYRPIIKEFLAHVKNISLKQKRFNFNENDDGFLYFNILDSIFDKNFHCWLLVSNLEIFNEQESDNYYPVLIILRSLISDIAFTYYLTDNVNFHSSDLIRSDFSSAKKLILSEDIAYIKSAYEASVCRPVGGGGNLSLFYQSHSELFDINNGNYELKKGFNRKTLKEIFSAIKDKHDQSGLMFENYKWLSQLEHHSSFTRMVMKQNCLVYKQIITKILYWSIDSFFYVNDKVPSLNLNFIHAKSSFERLKNILNEFDYSIIEYLKQLKEGSVQNN